MKKDHWFDQQYNKNRNIVKYCNLQELLEIIIIYFFETQLLLIIIGVQLLILVQ